MSLCDLQQSQLMIVDIQERLVGAMNPASLERMLASCDFLLKAADILQLPVVCSEQYPDGLGKTLSGITEKLPASAKCIDKTCFSCTGAPDFSEVMGGGRNQFILAGIESHVCILQTAMQLKEHGREVFVVEDACCSRSSDAHDNAMRRMAQAGIIITNAESVVFEWIRDSKHAGFRGISALLKQRG